MRLDLNHVPAALPSSAGITERFWDSLTTLPKSKDGYCNTQHQSQVNRLLVLKSQGRSNNLPSVKPQYVKYRKNIFQNSAPSQNILLLNETFILTASASAFSLETLPPATIDSSAVTQRCLSGKLGANR